MGKGGGAKSTTKLDKTQHRAMKSFLGAAMNASANGGFYDPQYNRGRSTVAGMDPSTTRGVSNLFDMGARTNDIYSTQGIDALTRSLGAFDPNETSLQNALGANADAMYSAFGRNVLPGINANAMNLGAVGSKRHGVTQGLALSDLTGQVGKMSTDMIFNAYKDHQANQAMTLNNLGQITAGLTSGANAEIGAGKINQDQQQHELDAALQAWAYENDVKYNNLAALKNLISGDMGTTTKTSGGGSGTGALAGGVGGTIIGKMMS